MSHLLLPRDGHGATVLPWRRSRNMTSLAIAGTAVALLNASLSQQNLGFWDLVGLLEHVDLERPAQGQYEGRDPIA